MACLSGGTAASLGSGGRRPSQFSKNASLSTSQACISLPDKGCLSTACRSPTYIPCIPLIKVERVPREPRKETGTLSHEPQGSQRQERTAEAFAARRRPRADAAICFQPPASAARPRAAVLDPLPQLPGLVPPPLGPERIPVRVPSLRYGSVRLRKSLRGSRSEPWRSGKAPRGTGSTPGASRPSVSAAARALVAETGLNSRRHLPTARLSTPACPNRAGAPLLRSGPVCGS